MKRDQRKLIALDLAHEAVRLAGLNFQPTDMPAEEAEKIRWELEHIRRFLERRLHNVWWGLLLEQQHDHADDYPALAEQIDQP
jgi:hypothetical protein